MALPAPRRSEAVAARADHERQRPVREMPLLRRHVDGIDSVHVEQLLHVAHHANDGVPRPVGGPDVQALPIGSATGEPSLRQRLADDDRSGAAATSRRIEQRGRAQRDAHRLEVSRGDRIAKRAAARRGIRPRLEVHAVHVEVAAQRQLAGERGAVHARQLAHRLERLAKNRCVAAAVVETRRPDVCTCMGEHVARHRIRERPRTAAAGCGAADPRPPAGRSPARPRQRPASGASAGDRRSCREPC